MWRSGPLAANLTQLLGSGNTSRLVITYQILSADVTDHLREYATFRAMGYGPQFFLGIVLEQPTVLGIFSFLPVC